MIIYSVVLTCKFCKIDTAEVQDGIWPSRDFEHFCQNRVNYVGKVELKIDVKRIAYSVDCEYVGKWSDMIWKWKS